MKEKRLLPVATTRTIPRRPSSAMASMSPLEISPPDGFKVPSKSAKTILMSLGEEHMKRSDFIIAVYKKTGRALKFWSIPDKNFLAETPDIFKLPK
jgi:hypothetical protein